MKPSPINCTSWRGHSPQTVDLAVSTVRQWLRSGDRDFRFDGGWLLAAVFPGFPDEFADRLPRLATDASEDDIGFILGILHNYKGGPATHPVVKTLVNRLLPGDTRLAEIEGCLQHAGVVSGEFGFVEAFRRKKAEVASWLDDERQPVRLFAEEYIRRLDGRIASEQRSAEQGREQYRRAFDDLNDRR